MVFDVKANDGSKFEMEHLHKMTMTEESPFYWLNHWYTGRYGKNVGILIEREKRPKEQFPGEVINITFGSPLFGDDTARRFLEEKNFSAKMFHFVAELDPVPSLLSFAQSISAVKKPGCLRLKISIIPYQDIN